MRSLVIFALVIAGFTALSNARHILFKRDVIDATNDDVTSAPNADSKEHSKEQINEEIIPNPDPKEEIKELDQHKEVDSKEGSKEEEKHNHSKEDEKENHSKEDKKHGHEHKKEKDGHKKHKHSKEDSKEKESSSSESNELSGDQFLAIIAIFLDPESHRPRVIAQEMPAGYGNKLLL